MRKVIKEIKDYQKSSGLLPANSSQILEDWKRTNREQQKLYRRKRRSATAGRNKSIALAFAEWLNEAFALRLFVSKYGEIVYGKGGQEGLKWPKPYKAGRKQFPIKWKNGGVEITTKGKALTLYTYRGKVYKTYDLQKNKKGIICQIGQYIAGQPYNTDDKVRNEIQFCSLVPA